MGDDDPFLEHGFLAALEDSGSVGPRAGIVPRFVLYRKAGRLAGALPLYLKTNSDGEFIFDWAWSNGAERAGIPYFPKLVAAVPFTPVTGRRFLLAPGADGDTVTRSLWEGARDVAEGEQASSIHVLFCTRDESTRLGGVGLLSRLSMQFHWKNRAPLPYGDFDDFLGTMKGRHRKRIRHERQIAAGHGLTIRTLSGPEMADRDWRAIETFYDANAAKHGANRYLTPPFFELVRATFAGRVVSTLAYRDDRPVAGTLDFEKGRHLFGRYWGCLEELPMLHFELCYHRLIERAIARGYTRFEAGAQGEHKLARGLGPAFTASAHFIRHPGLRAVVADYVRAEAKAVKDAVAAYRKLSPFKEPPDPDDWTSERAFPTLDP